ncbi:MAG: ribosome hibernation-promoting factor, HPF/YfiA family [Desulfohalobiaceae bacterium]
MEIAINFKNFEPSEQLKDYARTRFEKLEKFIKNPDNIQLHLNLEVEKFRQIAEAVLYADDIHLSAQDETEDMYATLDSVLDKMEVQVRKLKDKQKDKRKKRSPKNESIPEPLNPVPTGSVPAPALTTEGIDNKPMDVQEAMSQLQKSDYEFLVFFNADKNRVNVLYQRGKDEYRLIDPGM